MILGIGTDIVEIARMADLLQRYGHKFSERILHANEQQQLAQRSNQAAFLAKRFAAKEAVGKALGTGLGDGVTAPDIEVLRAENGRPSIRLHGQAQQTLLALGAQHCQISISDEKAYAVAFAVIE